MHSLPTGIRPSRSTAATSDRKSERVFPLQLTSEAHWRRVTKRGADHEEWAQKLESFLNKRRLSEE
ncbi:MAG: hypothetical protein JWL86_1276 [Rhizobium sp.]|nr:hypothetical protein [Rhizobium sp.]